jgi:hypothetical protein
LNWIPEETSASTGGSLMKSKWTMGWLALALFVVCYLASPYVTLWQVQRAIDAKDASALSEYIDFPSVRESLKDQVNAKMAREMEKSPRGSNGFAGLALLFGPVVVDRLVDSYVTPAGMASILDGNARAAPGSGNDSAAKRGDGEVTRTYRDLDRFDLVRTTADGKEVRMVLRRHGLFTWKVSEFIVPDF